MIESFFGSTLLRPHSIARAGRDGMSVNQPQRRRQSARRCDPVYDSRAIRPAVQRSRRNSRSRCLRKVRESYGLPRRLFRDCARPVGGHPVGSEPLEVQSNHIRLDIDDRLKASQRRLLAFTWMDDSPSASCCMGLLREHGRSCPRGRPAERTCVARWLRYRGLRQAVRDEDFMRYTRHRDLRTMRGYVQRAGTVSESPAGVLDLSWPPPAAGDKMPRHNREFLRASVL